MNILFSLLSLQIILSAIGLTVSIVWLTPYSIETWAAWLGHPIVIEWWKSLGIMILYGVFFRQGAIYIATMLAIVTWLFEAGGFIGF